MFVQGNRLNDIRKYFHKELSEKFSDSELKLILKTLYCKRFNASDVDFILAMGMRLSESDLLYFHSALKRLRVDEPFQYVVGETEFYGLILKTDKRALIPRPETEELVEWILTSEHPKNAIVDLCSGSGCIALALKSNLRESEVVAVEYSSGALELIRENCALTGLELHLVEADVLEGNYEQYATTRMDVIVSNPPYIPLRDKKLMERNVLDFEPEMALFVADEDPLIFYRSIIKNSPKLLRPEGWIYFEIHEDLAEGVHELFADHGFVNIELRKDLQNRNRMMRAQSVSFDS